jgi:hypothetical protein
MPKPRIAGHRRYERREGVVCIFPHIKEGWRQWALPRTLPVAFNGRRQRKWWWIAFDDTALAATVPCGPAFLFDFVFFSSMLLAEMFSEHRFTSPFVCAAFLRTCETGFVTVYLIAVALEASLLRKRFMSGAANTQEVFTRASGRCPFFQLIT